MQEIWWNNLAVILRGLNEGRAPSTGISEDIQRARKYGLTPREHVAALVGLLVQPVTCVCEAACSCDVALAAILERELDPKEYVTLGLEQLGEAKTLDEICDRIAKVFPGAWTEVT